MRGWLLRPRRGEEIVSAWTEPGTQAWLGCRVSGIVNREDWVQTRMSPGRWGDAARVCLGVFAGVGFGEDWAIFSALVAFLILSTPAHDLLLAGR